MTSSADTWYVSSTSLIDGPGTNWATAFLEIQAGVDAASAGDTVMVTNGVYTTGGAVAGLISNRVAITEAITVEGLNGPDQTTIVGQGPLGSNAVRCAYVGTGAVLRGFTLTNGHTDTSLSGGNEQGSGGGTLIDGGLVKDCILTDNHAHLAGGGAVIAQEDGGQVVNCTISNNTSFRNGGGLFFEKAGSATNCLITGNSSGDWNGGGVYCWNAGALINCTITDNTSTGTGDGIFFNGASTAVLINTIVWGNDADNYNAAAGSWTNCNTFPPVGLNSITNDPLFAGSGDYRLQAGSPCIDAGSPLAAPTEDIDGTARPIDGNLDGSADTDIGAYEYQISTGTPALNITNANASVNAGVAFYTAAGTNNTWITGHLAWTNAANAATGSVAAAGTAFSIADIPLAFDDNVITVTGTNALGEAAADTVTITRIGLPVLDITTSNATVSGNTATYAAAGSNSVWIIGHLAWTNAANAAAGSVAAAGTAFSIADIPLAFSNNLITVSGTNQLGEIASDSLSINRSTQSDSDGDGASDYYEYIADTDAADSNDWFRATAYSNSAVIFKSSSNRQYTLLYSTNLVDGIWTNVPGQTAIDGSGGIDALSTPTPDHAGFYRIQVEIR